MIRASSWLALLSMAAFVACGGCSVAGREPLSNDIAVNECTTNGQCGPGGRCHDGACVSSSGELSMLLFEVTPTSGEAGLLGQSYLMLESIPDQSGGSVDFLLDRVQVTGRVQRAIRAECQPIFLAGDATDPAPMALRPADDGTIPVRLSFAPVERTFGLAATAFAVGVETPDGAAQSPSYPFDLRLPAGTYDVYLEPFALSEISNALDSPTACQFPPRLLRGVSIERGSADAVDLQLSMPEPVELRLEVRWPDGVQNLDGWTVDMIEPRGGRVISNRVRLAVPSNDAGLLVYRLALAYLPVSEAADAGGAAAAPEFVRLTPPAGLLAPTVFLERSALELFARGEGVVTQLPRLTKAVTVDGFIFHGVQEAASAQVTFTAEELSNVPSGVFTSFTRQVDTRADDGRFRVELLPGRYRVTVVPTATGEGVPLAATQEIWEIAAAPLEQAGREITLVPAIAVNGRAVLKSGTGARGATISAEATIWDMQSSLLDRHLLGPPILPHADGSVVTEDSGAFSLYSEPGRFDLSIRPPEGSGLAWLIKPGLVIASGTAGVYQLGALELPLPVPLRVRAELRATRNPDEDFDAVQPLARAMVRAYALIDGAGIPTGDIASAKHVIPVAESRLDDAATTTLFVPATLDAPSPSESPR